MFDTLTAKFPLQGWFKNKRLFKFFIAFLKACNLEHFEKKDEYPSLIISEWTAKEVVT